MRLGSSKTFRKIDTPIVLRPRFQINGSDIDFLKETMCLGRILYDSLRWETAIECIRTRISRATGILKYANHYVQENTLMICILVL